MSKIETAIRVVLAFRDAYNHHDVPEMMHLMSDDCALESAHPAPAGSVYSGKDEVREFWLDFFRGSPQAHLEVEESFGFGERLVLRWKYRREEDGGEKEYIRGVDIFRVRNGTIREQLSYIKGQTGEEG